MEFKYELKGKTKIHRADVQKGAVATVDGFNEMPSRMTPVIRVELEIDGALRHALYAISETAIEAYKLSEPSLEGDCARPKKMPRLSAKLQYLTTSAGAAPDDSIDVVSNWVKAQHDGTDVGNIRTMKGLLTVGMGMNIEKKIGKYTADDVTVCKRNGEIEVWANRDFKPKELSLVAESSEIKDRFWNTVTNCAMTTGGTKRHHANKNLVRDGRLLSM